MHNSSLSGLSRGLQNRQQDGGVSWNSHKATKKPVQPVGASEQWTSRNRKLLLNMPPHVEQMLQRRQIYEFVVATHKRLCDDVQKLAAEFFSEP